jgi:hypothetical protein
MGAFFSILRLQSEFPRPLGDSANPLSHDFPVQVSVIADATVDRVIYDGAKGLVSRFVEVANEQITLGAIAVGTSCGFLFEHQATIQRQIAAPFISSSLIMLDKGLSEPIAVLSFDGDALIESDWFKLVRVRYQKMIVGGLPKAGHLYTVIRNNQTELNSQLASLEVVKSALDLARTSQLKFGLAPKTLLLECTNLGPYKVAIQNALNEAKYECCVIDYNDVMRQSWNALQKQTL